VRTGTKQPLLSAGVVTADLTRLGDELAILPGKARWAHVDVMDGRFCPQLTVGTPVIAAAAATGVPVDVHLMVTEPGRLLPELVRAGAALVTVHVESTRHPHRALTELTQLSAERPEPVLRGVAINPGTPVQAVEPLLELVDLILVLAVNPGWPGQSPAANTRRRIAAVRAMIAEVDAAVMVGVDGGVTLANAAEVASWGPDVVVSGSAIFNGGDAAANLDLLLDQLQATPGRPPVPS
jgi:ribulose-phosphate 3-epimerase